VDAVVLDVAYLFPAAVPANSDVNRVALILRPLPSRHSSHFLAASFRSRQPSKLRSWPYVISSTFLEHSVKRPRLSAMDRWVWAWLSATWPGWRTALVFVKPEAVVCWHRKGSACFGPGKVAGAGGDGRPWTFKRAS